MKSMAGRPQLILLTLSNWSMRMSSENRKSRRKRWDENTNTGMRKRPQKALRRVLLPISLGRLKKTELLYRLRRLPVNRRNKQKKRQMRRDACAKSVCRPKRGNPPRKSAFSERLLPSRSNPQNAKYRRHFRAAVFLPELSAEDAARISRGQIQTVSRLFYRDNINIPHRSPGKRYALGGAGPDGFPGLFFVAQLCSCGSAKRSLAWKDLQMVA